MCVGGGGGGLESGQVLKHPLLIRQLYNNIFIKSPYNLHLFGMHGYPLEMFVL